MPKHKMLISFESTNVFLHYDYPHKFFVHFKQRNDAHFLK